MDNDFRGKLWIEIVILVTWDVIAILCNENDTTYTVGVLVPPDEMFHLNDIVNVVDNWNAAEVDFTNGSRLQATVYTLDSMSFTDLKLAVENGTDGMISLDDCSTTLFDTINIIRRPLLLRANHDIFCSGIKGLHAVEIPYTRSTADVLEHLLDGANLELENMLLIHDSSTDLIITEVVEALDNLGIKHVSYIISDNTNAQKIETILKETHGTVDSGLYVNTILACNPSNLDVIFQEANKIERKIISRSLYYTRWLVVTTDNGTIQSIENNMGHLHNIALVVVTNKYSTTISERTKQALLVYNHSLSNLADKMSLDPEMDMSTLSLSQEMVNVVQTNGSFGNYDAFTLYQAVFAKEMEKVLPKTEIWDKTTGYYNEIELFNNIHLGFHNATFTVATLPYAPFVTKVTNETGSVYSGLCIAMLEELSTILNFSYNIVEPADQSFGVLEDNGQWSGLVGMAQTNQVDLVVAAIYDTEERKKAIDFSDPFMYEFSGITLQLPNPNEQKWRVVIEPFRWHVWITLFISIPFTGLVAWLATHLSAKVFKSVDDMFLKYEMSTWYVFGALLTQGGPYEPQTSAARSVIAAWWVLGIVMVATYGGNLIAFLTVNKVVFPFEDFKGMLNQNRYKFGTIGGTAYVDAMKYSNDSKLKTAWEKIEQFAETDPDVLHNSLDTHLHKVLEGDYALITDQTSVTREVTQNCDLSIIKYINEFPPYSYAIGMPANSSYRPVFSKQILLLQESGMLSYWRQKFWPKDECATLPTATSQPISLLDTQSAFIVLCGGLFLALSALVWEYIIKRRRKRCKVSTPVTVIKLNNKKSQIEIVKTNKNALPVPHTKQPRSEFRKHELVAVD